MSTGGRILLAGFGALVALSGVSTGWGIALVALALIWPGNGGSSRIELPQTPPRPPRYQPPPTQVHYTWNDNRQVHHHHHYPEDPRDRRG